MKPKVMNTHRVGQKSLQLYRPSKSSQKQSKSADMGQTGYAMEKGQFWLLTADFWDMCMKPKVMNTHRVGQKSLQPYRSSKSSQKQSKSANMGKKCYAMEKVAQISSRIILDVYESFWRSQNQSESAKRSQIALLQHRETVEPLQEFNYLDELDQKGRK